MSRPRKKILIVDDSPLIRGAVAEMLGEQGFDVVCVSSPFGFSHTLAEEKPDLVLMDVNMPALRGDKLVEVARRGALHKCPIVLFSDRPDAELAKLAKDCGASGYIRKTDDPVVLATGVKKHIKSLAG